MSKALFGHNVIVCGDWNIGPDKPTGRKPLQKLMVPSVSWKFDACPDSGAVVPHTDEREALGAINTSTSPVIGLLPYSHYSPPPLIDTCAFEFGLVCHRNLPHSPISKINSPGIRGSWKTRLTHVDKARKIVKSEPDVKANSQCPVPQPPTTTSDLSKMALLARKNAQV